MQQPPAPDPARPSQQGPVWLHWRTMLLFTVIFWALPLTWQILSTFIDDLIVVYVAVLITSSMHPVVAWLNTRRLPRALGILIIYLILVGILGVVGLLAVPLFTEETKHLIDQWPQYQQQLGGPLGRLGIHLGHGGPATTTQVQSVVAALPAIVVNITALLVNVVVILVLSFFFTADQYFAERLVAFIVPPQYRARTNELLGEIGHRMGRWVVGQLGIVLYYGVAFSIGLLVLKVPYALSVGIVTAILEIIPFVGGFVGLALALLVALGKDPGLLVPVIALYLIITNIEAHIIVPNLYGKAVQLHPATVIIGLLVGARAFGIVGALIAMPLAAGLQVLLESLYVQDVIQAAEAQRPIPTFDFGSPVVFNLPSRLRRRPSRPRPPADGPPPA